jgi:hypothetical protein
MYCYAVNGRSANPAHLWLTGCSGEMATHLQRIPGYDKWIIEKAAKPYIEAFEDRKENLVYLTADAEIVLDDLDMSKIYIIGGLVDRNRWKGITLKKSAEQGIQSAKLPIGNYLKMSSSQVSVYLFLPFTWKKKSTRLSITLCLKASSSVSNLSLYPFYAFEMLQYVHRLWWYLLYFTESFVRGIVSQHIKIWNISKKKKERKSYHGCAFC